MNIEDRPFDVWIRLFHCAKENLGGFMKLFISHLLAVIIGIVAGVKIFEVKLDDALKQAVRQVIQSEFKPK